MSSVWFTNSQISVVLSLGRSVTGSCQCLRLISMSIELPILSLYSLRVMVRVVVALASGVLSMVRRVGGMEAAEAGAAVCLATRNWRMSGPPLGRGRFWPGDRLELMGAAV